MTIEEVIEEVAEILNRCGGKKCDGCGHSGEENCRDAIIKDMAAEIRKIVEECEEDDK